MQNTTPTVPWTSRKKMKNSRKIVLIKEKGTWLVAAVLQHASGRIDKEEKRKNSKNC